MSKLWDWIKHHKLVVLLVLIILYLLFKDRGGVIPLRQNYDMGTANLSMTAEKAPLSIGRGGTNIIPPYQEAPPTTTKDRMVVSESYLSLLVSNVVNTQKKLIETAQQFGGYMVNSSLNNPQDAPTATVIVRLPSNKLNDALDKFRQLAIKVISENLQGEDVTDQFVDNEARLSTLAKTKAKFEDILDKATEVQDILNVQQQIINLQSQIDSIIGQQKYLEQTAKLAKITVYLSTDELALPYAPSEAWRPSVIFKQAVRSLITNFRKIGSGIIWVLVYSIIWLPILIIIYVLKKRKSIV